MGYLPPDSPMFAGAAVARGPGVHSDEASAALGDLRGQLEADAWDTLAAIVAPDGVGTAPDAEAAAAGGAAGAAANPNDEADPIVPQAELFPLAFLTTGMWGPDPPHNARALGLAPRRAGAGPSLPQANPYDPRSRLTFWERMARLEAEVAALAARVDARYRAARGGVSARRDPRVRPWASLAAKMRAAVRFLLAQRGGAGGVPSIFDAAGRPLGLPKGAWRVLAAQGNKKLPFVAYSELPMATCPGAGACAVRLDAFATGARRGWCYSFKAFRYAGAFGRQFFNTLCNYADREFAIMAVGGPADPAAYEGRVRAALAAGARPGLRLWPQYVKGLALHLTRRARAGGRPVFLRLFVDGDINYEDGIVAWMDAVAQMGPGGRDVAAGAGHVEVYGYSKCWQQFVNADAHLGGVWPANYTVNLSSGSVYFAGKYGPIRTAMEQLPVSRGYFEAIPLRDFIPQLARQTHLMSARPDAPVPLAPVAEQPFRFDADRIRMFVRINGVRTLAEARALFPDIEPPLDGRGVPRPLTEPQVRHLAYDAYLRRLLANPAFGAVVRRELLRDREPTSEPTFLDAFEAKQRARLERVIAGGRGTPEQFTDKALEDKALALVLHETLWSFGLGGSCPLVCGNCTDNPTTVGASGTSLAVHRCASRTTFRGKTIHIGIH